MNRQRQKLALTRSYGFQPGIRELWLNIGFSVAIECVKCMQDQEETNKSGKANPEVTGISEEDSGPLTDTQIQIHIYKHIYDKGISIQDVYLYIYIQETYVYTYLGGIDIHVCVLMQCPTPCDLVDCSPPGSSLHGILQARILEWVAMPSSKGSS